MAHRKVMVVNIILILLVLVCQAAAANSKQIPPELQRWQDWVLHGYESQLCPSRFNDSTATRCQWPARLNLDIKDDGAEFEQRWYVFTPGWVALPGDEKSWPNGVTLDGEPVVVIQRNKAPAVWVPNGEHHIQGRFFWDQKPELIGLPPSLGLLTLMHNGQPTAAPELTQENKLWLGPKRLPEIQDNSAGIKIFRLLRDTIPMQVISLLRLDVSGQGRELQLKGALPEGSIPMSVDSPLPARLNADNQLTVQARPGRWEIRVTARFNGPRSRLEAGTLPYGSEIWSFEPQHQLRMVEVLNVKAIEPSQTELPAAWRQFPAYLIASDDVLTLKEIRRGNPDPIPDQLSLYRTWWLDFSGKGFTIHDRIAGTLSQQWSLAMNPPEKLGRVAVNGRDQVISTQGTDKKAGVELRAGRLNMQADATLKKSAGPINVVGWDHNFQRVSGQLHLPPGWSLLTTSGIDAVSASWLQSWSLLDLFLVLIIALGAFKLRHWKWGLLALVLMILIFQEPGAPRLVWLHLLAVLALLPLLPSSWIKRLVTIWGLVAIATLILQALPFAVDQIRWGIYPQLAPHSGFDRFGGSETDVAPHLEEARVESADEGSTPKLSAIRQQRAPSLPKKTLEPGEVMHQDPHVLIPTGPGLPQWRWQTVDLTWSGPLAKDQTMRLYLLSPVINLILAVVRVGLMVWFIAGFFNWRPWWQKLQTSITTQRGAAVISMIPVLLMGTMITMGMMIMVLNVPALQADEVAGGFPPPALLEELRNRLLEKPECFPTCADIPRMAISLSDDRIQILLRVHAAVRTAVPLPVNRSNWTPVQVLMDNAPISGLAREKEGRLWAVVPAGVHTVVLSGYTQGQNTVQLPLYLKPHTVSVTAADWEVRGIAPDGSVASTIQLIRVEGAAKLNPEDQERMTAGMPPFFQVKHSIQLGLTWRLSTHIQRLTPPGSAAVLNIPLPPGASVTTPGIQTDQDHAQIHMAPDQLSQAFIATIPVTPTIEMTAPRAVPWVETWQLNAATIWHCEIEGLAPIVHQNSAGNWQPQWQPWPGESISIHVTRPPAIAGQTKTIDKVDLTLTPGRRFSTAALTLDMRASQGGQHTLSLPENTNLQSVEINGVPLAVRQEGQLVTVPVQPGGQTIHLQWHQAVPFSAYYKTPPVSVGQEAVNARVTLRMPANRWTLFTFGPRWGPAVLFWSYLVVIVLVALALGRISLTRLTTWQWLLLALGLTQVPTAAALVVVAWLIILGVRRRLPMPKHWLPFNGIQIGLMVLTAAAFFCLFTAVKSGLLGQPQMNITGNGSTHLAMHWTQDHIAGSLPRASVLSLSVWVYRGLMLVWSLWLAVSLIKWLKWGWSCFTTEALWKKISLGRRRKPSNATHEAR